jgi:formylglycine-generating enzyme required for sulfatase activity
LTQALPGGVSLEMLPVAPGTFLMGSPEDEPGQRYDETQHSVRISSHYWLGKYAVTQAQWKAVMGNNPSKFKGAQHPVENVSWNSAVEFCERLTEQARAAGRLPEGYRYTLPTESQWERACRAGTTGAYGGTGNLEDMAFVRRHGEPGGTHPVGGKLANAWGFYDMHDNVWEWCLDWYGSYPSGSVTDPTGAPIGKERVHRGGSWDCRARRCRSASRSSRRYYQYDDFADCGFRVALAPEHTSADTPADAPALVPANAPTPAVSNEQTLTLPGGISLAMLPVAPGTFLMGSPEEEPGRRYNETQHRVRICDPYWLGKFPVTRAQWNAVMQEAQFLRNEQHPETHVSWHDAVEFCEKLTVRERDAGRLPAGYHYSLPTETQWERACRAGTTGAYGGTGNLSKMGWDERFHEETYNGTYPVGQKLANAWGFYDMHGNVGEWCSDWDGVYPTRNIVNDPAGHATGKCRIVRGGGSHRVGGFSSDCRSAFRDGNIPGRGGSTLGFRLALTPIYWPALPLAQEPKPVLGEAFTRTLLGGVPLEMLPVAPGAFLMGSPENEPGRRNDETQHRARLTKPYWLGKFPVTKAQWNALMGDAASFTRNAQHPKGVVTWDDAMKFCAKLTKQERDAGRLPEGYRYTLPTETQWERACRAGTTGAYGGSGNLDEMGWYRENSDYDSQSVGQKSANAWGFYDMHGSIWEWCADWYGCYPQGSVTDPTGGEINYERVRRGGAERSVAQVCRSACRGKEKPGTRYTNLGFRLALAPVPEGE